MTDALLSRLRSHSHGAGQRLRHHRALLAPLLALGALLTLLAGCGTQAGAWRLIGPDDGAHVYAVAADPHVAGLVYAGADDGGVYRGLADQTGHVVSGSGIPRDATVASVLPDPIHAGVVLAGTSAGLSRSSDYGDHWSAFGAGLPGQRAVVALAATPDDATLLAGIDQGGLYRSVNDGAAWTAANSGLPTQGTPVALAWDAPDHIWLAGLVNVTGPSLYASADGGQTWTPRATGLPSGAQVNDLTALGGSSPTLFAATTQGVYSSVDVGQRWGHVSGGLPQGSALALATLPQRPTWVYVSIGSAVYRSTDGGAHWADVAPGLSSSVQALAATQGKQGGPVVYVAVGQLARYPTGIPGGGSGVPDWFVLVIVLLALVIGGYTLSRRSRRFGYAMGALRNESNTGRAAEASERWQYQQRESSAPSDANRPASGGGAAQRTGDDAQPGDGHVIAPSDLTSRASTGIPADEGASAQNGHGKPRQRG
ncbi:MAG TPA: hypothetical protein VFN78_04700 [Ktedonobacterales bacterium]|nr:hypothetical protein [Ktedonobacterales bacterium]